MKTGYLIGFFVSFHGNAKYVSCNNWVTACARRVDIVVDNLHDIFARDHRLFFP